MKNYFKNNEKTYIFAGGAHHKEKYDENKIHQILINGFMEDIKSFARKTGKKDFFEAGCGEGQILGVLYQAGYTVEGMDISDEAIDMTKNNFRENFGLEINCFEGSIYEKDLLPHKCIICCEVLEHLTDPDTALKNIVDSTDEYFIVSVPREPIWCILNFLRGKYWSSFGNTPGHINHWSKKSFKKFIGQYADVVEVKKPLPWTVILGKVRSEVR